MPGFSGRWQRLMDVGGPTDQLWSESESPLELDEWKTPGADNLIQRAGRKNQNPQVRQDDHGELPLDDASRTPYCCRQRGSSRSSTKTPNSGNVLAASGDEYPYGIEMVRPVIATAIDPPPS